MQALFLYTSPSSIHVLPSSVKVCVFIKALTSVASLRVRIVSPFSLQSLALSLSLLLLPLLVLSSSLLLFSPLLSSSLLFSSASLPLPSASFPLSPCERMHQQVIRLRCNPLCTVSSLFSLSLSSLWCSVFSCAQPHLQLLKLFSSLQSLQGLLKHKSCSSFPSSSLLGPLLFLILFLILFLAPHSSCSSCLFLLPFATIRGGTGDWFLYSNRLEDSRRDGIYYGLIFHSPSHSPYSLFLFLFFISLFLSLSLRLFLSLSLLP